MKVAYAELRDRMDRVMPDLPDEVERVEVRHWDSEDWPIIWMGSASTGMWAIPSSWSIPICVRPCSA